ncbi:MAG: hypothetical protein IKV94_05510 [Clostridia bacterium]|nr:hypothetical protein [Clostridia bacterium]
MYKQKKGITVSMVALLVIIIAILTTTITVSVSNSLKNSKLRAFATELSYIQDTVNEHNYATTDRMYVKNEVKISPNAEYLTTQFSEEKDSEDNVILYTLDLEKLGIEKTVYGKGEDATDVYAVSLETNRVFYVKGYEAPDKVYYTLTDDLKVMLSGDDGKKVISKNIVFVPNKIGWANEPIQVNVKVPKEFSNINITTNVAEIKVGEMTTSDTNSYVESVVNYENRVGNYSITVTYTQNGVSKTQNYAVETYDVTAPTITVGEQTHSTGDYDKSFYAYIENVTATDDNKLKVLKHATLEVNEENAKEYFSNSGKEVDGKKIRIEPYVHKYTIYAEDYAGNFSIQVIEVDSDIYEMVKNWDEAWPGVNKQSTGTNTLTLSATGSDIINYRIYGNSIQQGENLFDKTTMLGGFLPTSGAYPTTNASYPQASYQIIEIKTNDVFDITYTGDGSKYGRIFYIDSDTNEVKGYVSATSNTYFTSTANYSNGYVDGKITAKKDFKLGVMHLKELPQSFDLQIRNTTPTVDNPIEIQSVGEKTNNLFDIKDRTLGTLTSGGANTEIRQFEFDKYYVGLTMNNYYYPTNISQYEVVEDVVKVSSKASGYGVGVPFQVKSNTSYTVKCDGENTRIGIGFYTAEGEWLSYVQTATFTTPENCGIVVILFRPDVGVGLVTYYNIHLVEGTKIAEYEPYGKYKIPIRVRGKNLFNIENIYESRVTNGYVEYFDDHSGLKLVSSQFNNGYSIGKLSELCPNLKVGDTFCINFETNGFRYNTTVDYVYLNTYGSSIYKGKSYICTQKMLDSAVYCYTGTVSDAYIKNIQFEIGTVATEYEPYYESITKSIYLDEPLRKIGENSDYIDFKAGTENRGIGKVSLDDTQPYVFYKYNNDLDNTYHYYINTPNNKEPLIIQSTPMLCNRFPAGDIVMNRNAEDSFVTSRYGIKIYGQIQKSLIDNYTGESEKDRLIQYFSDNYTEVEYVLNTSSTEVIELPDLPTFKGTTIIEVLTDVSPSSTVVNYYTKGT